MGQPLTFGHKILHATWRTPVPHIYEPPGPGHTVTS